MQITLTSMGWVVVPCTFVLALISRKLLLPWTAFVSVFQAASIANVTLGTLQLSLQPGFFAAGIACVVLLLFPISGNARWAHARRLRSVYIPLSLFAIYAWISSYWIVQYFTGKLYVGSPRSHSSIATLLTFTGSNVNQDIDLVLALLLFVVVCESVYAARDEKVWSGLIDGWLLGGVVASCVGLYQIAATHLGLGYASDFFNSNTIYFQQFDAQLAGLRRLSGTFSEPSEAALFLAPIFAFGLWKIVHGKTNTLIWISTLTSGAALLLTTSSTAYIILPLAVIIVIFPLLTRVRHSARTVVGVSALIVMLGASIATLVVNRATVDRVVTETIINKTQGGSYASRMGTNQEAWDLNIATGGLGVGWGSMRASSLPLNILGNGGVWGLMTFLWAIVEMIRVSRRGGRLLAGEVRVEMSGILTALAILAAAATLAVPDFLQIPAWMLLPLATGLGARAHAALLSA